MFDQGLFGHVVDDRMVAGRDDALPQHHLHPARQREELVAGAEIPPPVAEHVDLPLQGVGDRHGPAVVPERAVVPPRGAVVQDQEVARAFVFERRFLVELPLEQGIETTVGEQAQQPLDTGLDQVDAGGFQRLHETAGQPQGDDVPVPQLPAHAGGEAQRARVGKRTTVEVGQQRGGGFVVADVLAGIHIAIADPALQGNAPLPSRCAGGGAGVRRRRACRGARHRHGAVAGQPVRPVDVTGLQRLFDQQATETGAVDEQVAGDLLPALEHHGFDEAVFAALQGVGDLPFDALHATPLRQLTQVARVQPRVEVIGIGDVRQWRIRRDVARAGHELPQRRGQGRQRVLADGPRAARVEELEPELVERQRPDALADPAEAVDVGVADPAPVVELDAELEGALGAGDEIELVDAQQASVELLHVRDAGLAHADDPDLLGFDQADGCLPAQVGGQRGRRHPARAASAHDDDGSDGVAGSGHGRSCSSWPGLAQRRDGVVPPGAGQSRQQLVDLLHGRHGGERALARDRQRTYGGGEAHGSRDSVVAGNESGDAFAKPVVLRQMEQQPADERIAGRGGIQRGDPERIHRAAGRTRMPDDGPGAVRHDQELRPMLPEALQDRFLSSQGSRQVLQFLPRQLHQVGLGQRLPQPRRGVLALRPQGRAQVHVDADRGAAGARTPHAFVGGIGDVGTGQAVRTDMEHARTLEARRLEMRGPEQQVGGRRPVEAETALAVFVQRHERQRRLRLASPHDAVRGDAHRRQAVEQEVAEHVLAQHAGEVHVGTQSSRRHRHVRRRTARVLQEIARSLRRCGRLGQHVDQGLAEADDLARRRTHADALRRKTHGAGTVPAWRRRRVDGAMDFMAKEASEERQGADVVAR